MNVGIGTEAALFPEKEYIMEMSFAVHEWDGMGGVWVGAVGEQKQLRIKGL